MKKLLLLTMITTIGFISSFLISLYIGTQNFSYYCTKALSIDTDMLIGSKFTVGVEEQGFKDCVLNTPTLDPFVFIIVSSITILILQVYLITFLKEKRVFMFVSLITAFYMMFYIFLAPYFQSIIWHISFMNSDSVWVYKDGLHFSTLYFPFFSLLLLFIFFPLSQLGPSLFSLYTRRIRPQIKPNSVHLKNSKSFPTVLFHSTVFNLILFITLAVIVIGSLLAYSFLHRGFSKFRCMTNPPQVTLWTVPKDGSVELPTRTPIVIRARGAENISYSTIYLYRNNGKLEILSQGDTKANHNKVGVVSASPNDVAALDFLKNASYEEAASFVTVGELASNMSYTAKYQIQANGCDVDKSFTFTTGSGDTRTPTK